MAFLTCVGLEGNLREEEDEQPRLLALPAPKPRRKVSPQTSSLELLDKLPPAQKAVDYTGILKDACALTNGDEDPLEELRRMIRRTRGRMDNQTKVLNGFISEVNQIKGLQRSFSCTEIDPRDANCAPGKISGPAAAALQDQRPAALHDRPSSASRANARTLALRSNPPNAMTQSRSQPTVLGPSQSQSSLLALRNVHGGDAAPLALPARRAPPGVGRPEITRKIATRAEPSARVQSLPPGSDRGRR